MERILQGSDTGTLVLDNTSRTPDIRPFSCSSIVSFWVTCSTFNNYAVAKDTPEIHFYFVESAPDGQVHLANLENDCP